MREEMSTTASYLLTVILLILLILYSSLFTLLYILNVWSMILKDCD